MRSQTSFYRTAAVLLLAAGLLAWPAAGQTHSITGRASAVRATTLGLLGGSTAVLADTGTLSGPGDAREASLLTGGVPALLRAEVLDAVTLSWTDQVTSTASLAGLAMSLGGVGLSADVVMARATAAADGAGGAGSIVEGLSINGSPIAVSGQPNQVVPIPGGQLVINEQVITPAGSTVNALHATVLGVADVVIASATAGR